MNSRWVDWSSKRRLDATHVLQLIVAVVVAFLGAAAGLAASEAAGQRESAIRQEIDKTIDIVADVELVYTEARLALGVVVNEIEAEELRRAAEAAGPSGESALIEASIRQYSADLTLFRARGTGNLLDGERYRSPDGDFLVIGRLADQRMTSPSYTLDPDATQRLADIRGGTTKTLTLWLAIIVIGYLTVGWGWIARRRRGEAGVDDLDPGLIPQPWSSSISGRAITTLALIGWVFVTMVGIAQFAASDEEQKYQALATRETEAISANLTANGFLIGLDVDGKNTVRSIKDALAARLSNALRAAPSQREAQRVVALAELAALPRIVIAVKSMSRLPDGRDNVDAATRSALMPILDAKARTAEQRRLVDRAGRAGAASDRLTVALLFGASASGVAALAASRPQASIRPLFAPIILLMLGLGIGFAPWLGVLGSPG